MAHLAAPFLNLLRCPVTGSALVQEGENLRSEAEGPDGVPVTYGIDEGIPVLLRAELLQGTRSDGAPRRS